MNGVYYDAKGNLIGIQEELTEEIIRGYDLNQLATVIHENSVRHGWWDEPKTFGDIIALCHSELSEALEAYREGQEPVWDNNGKPDGMLIEMADCVIRIFDYFGYVGADVVELFAKKMSYNKNRSYRHGGKKL